MSTDRRSFLKQAALGAAASAVPAVATAATAPLAATSQHPSQEQLPAGTARALDAALLQAMGEVVLPSALGAEGQRRALDAFATWIAGYRPVAEEMHGYGQAEITFTPSDPLPGWQAQLEGLELLAQRSRSAGFATLDADARREIVKAALARVGDGRIPLNPAAAAHIAVALLAHWSAQSASIDLAYGARIGTNTCRGLEGTSRKPQPLATDAIAGAPRA